MRLALFQERVGGRVESAEGTPEENSRMLRVAGRIMGAADVGFVKLNEKSKKLLYGGKKANAGECYNYQLECVI